MRLCELQYALPPELIAQQPVEPRDSSRLMVLDRARGRIEHRVFRDIAGLLRAGDVLVLNDTRVIPARFFARRRSGGRVEGLFLRVAEDGWRALLRPSSRIRVGELLTFEPAAAAVPALRVVRPHERGEWTVLPSTPTDPLALLEQIGQTPLPPYIRRADGVGAADAERYQTVFAAVPGAVAAPTAGLHFTSALLQQLAEQGVAQVRVTLHVGLGTFGPIEVEQLAEHRMHREWFSISGPALQQLAGARREGGRIVAVGTTCARVLESVRLDQRETQSGWTEIFLYPPYEFRNTDALITNFHLPGSTLLALVMALAGPDAIERAYAEAIRERYRFYSYGDALFIA